MKYLILALSLVLTSTGFASQVEVQVDTQNITTTDYVSYDFGTVWVNSRSRVRYTVTNTGDTPLTYKEAYIWGGDFRAGHNCSKGLLPKEKCIFEIEYWPVFEGLSSGRFLLTFNEDDEIRVDLWGRARRM